MAKEGSGLMPAMSLVDRLGAAERKAPAVSDAERGDAPAAMSLYWSVLQRAGPRRRAEPGAARDEVLAHWRRRPIPIGSWSSSR